jgi:hypothetical protein
MRSSACQHRVRLVLLAGNAEHHVQEVGGVVEVVARIHERLADVVFVGHRRERRHLGDQSIEGDAAILGVGEISRVVIEGRQRADHADHHRHRVRVAAEALIEPHQLLMHHGVLLDRGLELALLGLVRQFAVLQQIGDFEEVAVLRQLFDRVAAVQQLTLITIDEGDLRLATGRGKETGVVGEQAGLGAQGTDVDDIVAMHSHHHGKLVTLAIYSQRCCAIRAHEQILFQVR